MVKYYDGLPYYAVINHERDTVTLEGDTESGYRYYNFLDNPESRYFGPGTWNKDCYLSTKQIYTMLDKPYIMDNDLLAELIPNMVKAEYAIVNVNEW